MRPATKSAQYDSQKAQPGTQASHQSSPPEDGATQGDAFLFQEDFGSGLCTDVGLLGGTEDLDLNLQGWPNSALDPTFPDIMEATTDTTFTIPQASYSLSGPSTATPTPLASLSSAETANTPSSSSTIMTAMMNNFFSPKNSKKDSSSSSGNNGDGEGEFTFPDSYLLPMAELALFRAFTRIAKRLGCGGGAVWSLDARSPFVTSRSPSPSSPLAPGGLASVNLPAHLRPTLAQSTVPHHPVLDFLPWPVVRDRLITVLSMPDGVRPPVAGGTSVPASAASDGGEGSGDGGGGVPMALVQLSYDMEHTAEGIRIWGPDIYDPRAWEVGQVFFEKWWFIFDREVVEQSNYWRRMRGAKELCVKGSSGGVV